MTNTYPPIISIVGRSGVGKTTFLTRLIAELKRRNYRVAIIKHRSPVGNHGTVEIDQPGKDTWKHYQAGADTVILATNQQLVMFQRLDQDPSPDELVTLIPKTVDLVITEGYKRAGKPAIELVRANLGRELVGNPDNLIALVSDLSTEQLLINQPDIPRFGFEDETNVADFLERFLNLSPAHRETPPPAER